MCGQVSLWFLCLLLGLFSFCWFEETKDSPPRPPARHVFALWCQDKRQPALVSTEALGTESSSPFCVSSRAELYSQHFPLVQMSPVFEINVLEMIRPSTLQLWERGK